jgi:hypothetical protein
MLGNLPEKGKQIMYSQTSKGSGLEGDDLLLLPNSGSSSKDTRITISGGVET